MFEQIFKRIDDVLWKDAGCSSELDYVEQTSWVLFLKYLDDLEKDRKTAAELSGKKYANIISKEFQWNTWAAPKLKDGKIDHNALTSDDLNDFVNIKLFPYLKKFKSSAESADTIEYKIGEIFSELKNKIQSGYNLREVINLVDQLRFRTNAEKHEMSHLYEAKIQNMGNAGRNGGEYYTPRPLIRTIVKVVAPKIGDKIYDGAVGSAGFLCEAFNYLKESKSLTTKDIETLQKKTFYGKEKKSLAYIIGTMNMIFHGVEAPNIVHTNTLAENIQDIQEKDRYDVVLANPPFGGKERAEVQQNFPIRTGETAFLFLQHFIKKLKAGGRAGIVIKNTFLSDTNNSSVSLRKLLLESCNLHSVLDLPGGAFFGAGVKTVVLFFEKGKPTKKIWYYQLNLERNLGKTKALNEEDLADFVLLQKTKADSENSWSVDVGDVNQTNLDLSVKNPNEKEGTTLRQPEDILREIKDIDKRSIEILSSVEFFENDLKKTFLNKKKEWKQKKLGEVCDFQGGSQPPKKDFIFEPREGYVRFLQIRDFGSDKHITYIPVSKKNRHCNENDILLGRYGASVGKVLVNKAGAYNVAVMKTIPNDVLLNKKYLFFYLMSDDFQKRLLKVSSRSAQNGFSKDDIYEFPILLPPLPEQQNIAEKLEKLNSEVEKLDIICERKKENFKELKKSILKKVFNSEI